VCRHHLFSSTTGFDTRSSSLAARPQKGEHGVDAPSSSSEAASRPFDFDPFLDFEYLERTVEGIEADRRVAVRR
jgi:hypothetical protein